MTSKQLSAILFIIIILLIATWYIDGSEDKPEHGLKHRPITINIYQFTINNTDSSINIDKIEGNGNAFGNNNNIENKQA